MNTNKTFKLDGKTIESHLYTEKEVQALMSGEIQKIHTANVKTGIHQLTAFVTGKGPNGRDYRRAVTYDFEKDQGCQFVQLKMVLAFIHAIRNCSSFARHN